MFKTCSHDQGAHACPKEAQIAVTHFTVLQETCAALKDMRDRRKSCVEGIVGQR